MTQRESQPENSAYFISLLAIPILCVIIYSMAALPYIFISQVVELLIKILLLEDDDTISFGIEAALKRKGYDCITCPSIEQGRKLFSSDIRLIPAGLKSPRRKRVPISADG